MKRNKIKVVCECGAEILGSSEDHAKANLKLHKESKTHKAKMFDKLNYQKNKK